MSKTEEITKIYVGVDLHKTQFTVNAIDGETGEVVLIGMFRTDCEGYNAYIEKMHCIEEKSGNSIEMAVEATGNARYFKNRMEKEGFGVVVVNTNKFKVIAESTKKTDANDAATLAFYLSKGILSELISLDPQKIGEVALKEIFEYKKNGYANSYIAADIKVTKAK